MNAPPQRDRRQGTTSLTATTNHTTGSLTTIAEGIDHFVHRLIQDAVADADRRQWLRRAQMFEDAKPKPGDYNGSLTPEQIRQQWRTLDGIARACRARAELCPLDSIAEDVASVLREVV